MQMRNHVMCVNVCVDALEKGAKEKLRSKQSDVMLNDCFCFYTDTETLLVQNAKTLFLSMDE